MTARTMTAVRRVPDPTSPLDAALAAEVTGDPTLQARLTSIGTNAAFQLRSAASRASKTLLTPITLRKCIFPALPIALMEALE